MKETDPASDTQFPPKSSPLKKLWPPPIFEETPSRFTERFGLHLFATATRREYHANDGSVTYFGFHSGLDFCGGTGLQIDAAAEGVVVFAAPTIVRGNATVIDHGWGVFTGYWHQSESYVQVGDHVNRQGR